MNKEQTAEGLLWEMMDLIDLDSDGEYWGQWSHPVIWAYDGEQPDECVVQLITTEGKTFHLTVVEGKN